MNSSLWRRERCSPQEWAILADWPVHRRRDWADWVNEPQADKRLAELREAVRRGRPFGDAD